MREILFRGFHPDKNEKEKVFVNGNWIKGFWVYGYYVKAKYHWHKYGIHEDFIITSCYQNGGYFNVAGRYAVIPETVGQYTGLQDKNGKSIFENGYMIIDNKTYKVIIDNAEYILTNIFDCDIITLKNNSIKGVFVDERSSDKKI